MLALYAIASGLWDRSGDTVVRTAQFWSRLVLRAAGVKVIVHRAAPLDPTRPYVFMSNHVSASDIWSLFVAIPFPVRFIAKKQLAKLPFVGWAMRIGRFIFIDRQNASAARRSIDEAARRISEGASVMIFPEGTRSRDGKLGPFKKGGFHLAVDSRVDIVPVGIRGTREVMPKGAALIRSGEIIVEMGAPIPTVGVTDAERLALIDRVRDIVLTLTGEAASAPAPAAVASSPPASA